LSGRRRHRPVRIGAESNDPGLAVDLSHPAVSAHLKEQKCGLRFPKWPVVTGSGNSPDGGGRCSYGVPVLDLDYQPPDED
jgi:hypothetical protein